MRSIALFGIAFVAFCLLAGSVSAFTLAPIFNYEMALHHDTEIDGAEVTQIGILAFYEYSKSWELVLVSNNADVPPYDNFNIGISCNDGEEEAELNTTEYADWVSSGRFSISFSYQDDSYPIAYNEYELNGKYSACEISVNSYNDSFNNNPSYETIGVEMIPLLSPVEFINCSQITSATISIANELDTFFVMVGDFWDIIWYIYSIAIIVFTLFGIPLLLFMLIRWVLYRVAGVRIGGEG